eukprot:6214275-Pleurochrysis_carterae.AAC.3
MRLSVLGLGQSCSYWALSSNADTGRCDHRRIRVITSRRACAPRRSRPALVARRGFARKHAQSRALQPALPAGADRAASKGTRRGARSQSLRDERGCSARKDGQTLLGAFSASPPHRTAVAPIRGDM